MTVRQSSDACHHVPQRKPPARQQQPDDVAHQAGVAGSQVVPSRHQLPRYGFPPEWKQREFGDDEA